MVESGEIDIPEFQKEFIWSENQVRDLAESIYKGYPIGLLTLFKIPTGLKSKQEQRFVNIDVFLLCHIFFVKSLYSSHSVVASIKSALNSLAWKTSGKYELTLSYIFRGVEL
jgi:uncharacterized protein with ParB-like and HNH nuclease domain